MKPNAAGLRTGDIKGVPVALRAITRVNPEQALKAKSRTLRGTRKSPQQKVFRDLDTEYEPAMETPTDEEVGQHRGLF